MQTSTIKFSQIEDRIDAEYYKPEYLEILNTSKRAIKINEVADVTNGAQPKIFNKGSIKFFSIKDLDNIFLNDTEARYISNEFFLKNPDGQITKNDILLAITGATIGKVAISDYEKAFISGDLARIRCNKVSAHYLVIFFLSRFGQNQIYKNIFGATNKHLSIKSIKSFYIEIPPQSFQQKIEKMVKEAQAKRELADEKYKEAEEILNKELGLQNLDLSTQKTFEAKFSEAEDRIDPEYYQPKYKKIKGFLSNKKLTAKSLKSFVKKYNCGFAFPTEIYLAKGIPLLRIKNLKRLEIDFEGVEFLPDLNEYQEFVAKSGDILISMSGTVGMASLVPTNIPKAFVNQRITSISTEGVDKLYLCLYLNLPAINSLITKKTTGGVQKNITYQDIISVPIPILSQSLQQKISSLIQGSFKLRQEAKQLIDRAKREVEGMVEGK